MTTAETKKIEDTYLGDGVYASFDGYQIWLDLRAQPDAVGQFARIALEPQVLESLDRYRQSISDAFAAEGK